MAGSVNKAIIVGNLGRDPEIRYTQDGSKLAQISVATSEQWKDRQTGERRERTEWHRVVIFDPNLADVAEQYLRKGSKIFIEGQLQTRKWQDQEGRDRYTTEVVVPRFRGTLTMLDSRSGGGDTGGDFNQGDGGGDTGGFGGGSGGSTPDTGGGDLDDDIPF